MENRCLFVNTFNTSQLTESLDLLLYISPKPNTHMEVDIQY